MPEFLPARRRQKTVGFGYHNFSPSCRPNPEQWSNSFPVRRASPSWASEGLHPNRGVGQLADRPAVDQRLAGHATEACTEAQEAGVLVLHKGQLGRKQTVKNLGPQVLVGAFAASGFRFHRVEHAAFRDDGQQGHRAVRRDYIRRLAVVSR